MINEEELIKKYTKQQLLDFAKKIVGIHTSLMSEVEGYDENTISSINSKIYKELKMMAKSEICFNCWNISTKIVEFNVEPRFNFFWNDGGSDSIKQDLYNMIGEKDDLVDKFIHTDYFNLFWSCEILYYKLKLLDCELVKDFFTKPEVKKTLLNKNEIITQWKGYKSIYDKGALLDDDELI